MNRIGDWGVLIGIFLIFTLTGSISFYDKSVDGAQVSKRLHLDTAKHGFTGAVHTISDIRRRHYIGRRTSFYRCNRQICTDPAIHMAARRHGRPYAGFRADPRRDDGYRGRLHGRPLQRDLQNAPTAMFIVALIGCGTAIFAASIGLAQNDIKKVLAYSTISQLGYMFLACGVGAFIAAIFHVMTHAFFKALLFLGSGSVINGMHHEQDMRRMGICESTCPSPSSQ